MKKLLAVYVLILISNFLYSQVGINTENPNKLSSLDVENLMNGLDTIPRGMVIPRMSQTLRDQIDVSNRSLANGLVIYNINEDCFNFYSKTETAWISLCNLSTRSVFTINCDDTKVYGSYIKDTPVTDQEYITVKVTVTQKGSYSIKAISNPDNGYYFQKEGEFYAAGVYTLKIPAIGQPNTVPTTSINHFVLEANGTTTSCGFDVEVKDKTFALIYDIINATITTDGVYMKGKALSGTNQIRLSLRVRSGFGRNYTVKTETVNGVSFTATGVLTDEIQPIILQGTGTLTTSTTLLLELFTNTELSTPIYYAKIDPVMSGVRMLTLGDFSVGGANVGDELSMVNAMLRNTQNFGLESNSVVKVAPFVTNGTIISSDLGPGIISRATISDTELTNFATSTKPDYVDIIVICFRWFPTLDQSTLLANYAKNGGVLLVFGEDTSGFRPLIQNIYGSQTTLSTNRTLNPKGSVYKLGNFDDPILNGPFGNLKNTYWGKTGWGSESEWLSTHPTEASFTAYGDALIVNNFLAEDAIVYSSNFNYNSTDATQVELPYTSTALRHREYPFLFVGDGGFTTGYPGSTAYDRFPFLTGTKTVRSSTHANYPIARPAYGVNAGTYRTNVYNSIFFANAIAWALSQTKPD